MTVGQRIKEKRLELNLSVDALAEKLGKNRATIYRYENGDIENLPISILEPIAEALRTTPAYLMGWKDEGDEMLWIVDSHLAAIKESFPNDEFSRLKPEGHDSRGLPMWTLHGCTGEEARLLTSYWRLNEVGRAEAEKRISELGKLDEYVSESARRADESEKLIENYAEKRLKDGFK